MRVIALKALKTFIEKHARARSPLMEWYKKVDAAEWNNFSQTRRTFPHADQVKVKSGKIATIFNAGGNDYRIVAAIHYNTRKVFILRVLTHAEYDRGSWRDPL